MNESHLSAVASLSPNTPWTERVLVQHRRLVGILIPLIFFQLVWWSLAIKWNYFQYFPDKYPMTITMVFGAMIAGKV